MQFVELLFASKVQVLGCGTKLKGGGSDFIDGAACY